MAHIEQRQFVEAVKLVHPEWFDGKRVLEIGSRVVNGGVRDLWTNGEYVGLDCEPGIWVDVVSLAHEYRDQFPYDVIVSCEVFEHDPYFRQTIDNAMSLLRSGGLFLATWASPERDRHGTPDSDGETYGPDPSYYCAPSLGHFVEAISGRLKPMSLSVGQGGLDLYAIGWRG